MTRRKKYLLFLAVVLLVGCMVFRQSRRMCLGDLLPERDWTKVTLEQMVEEDLNGDIWFESPPMEEILILLHTVQVRTGREQRGGANRSFRIALYQEDAWPTVLYVEPSGTVMLAVDMQYDSWMYYTGGEGLYAALEELAGTLSAQTP